MEKQVEKKKTQTNLASLTNMEAWGPANITAKDMVIPKILAQQFMSEKVKNEEAKYGEMRDTLSNNKFGDLETPFEVVPFLLQKKWIEFDLIPQKGGGVKREFKNIVMIQDNPGLPGFNDDLPLRDEEAKLERDRVMDFFVLIPEEVKKGEALPYVLSFRRTSLKAGQKMATQMFVRNAAAGKIPPATAMEVSMKSKENDDGEFVVLDVIPKRESTPEEVEAAFKWFKIIKAGGAKVDEREYEKEATVKVDADIDTKEF